MEKITNEDLSTIINLIDAYNDFLIAEYNDSLSDDENVLLNKLKSISDETN